MASRIGDFLRPELGKTDFSGFLQGSAQGSAALGQGIGQGITSVAGGLKERAESKKRVAGFEKFLESTKQIVPEGSKYYNMLEGLQLKIADAPLREALGIAEQGSKMMQFMGDQLDRDQSKEALGFQREVADRDYGLAKEEFDLKRGQAMIQRWTQQNTPAPFVDEFGRKVQPAAPRIGPEGEIIPGGVVDDLYIDKAPFGIQGREYLDETKKLANQKLVEEHVALRDGKTQAPRDIKRLEQLKEDYAKLSAKLDDKFRVPSSEFMRALQIPFVNHKGPHPLEAFAESALSPLERYLRSASLELAQVAARQRNPKGQVTDADFEFARQSLMSIAKDKETNWRILDDLTNKIEADALEWNSRDEFLRKTGDLLHWNQDFEWPVGERSDTTNLRERLKSGDVEIENTEAMRRKDEILHPMDAMKHFGKQFLNSGEHRATSGLLHKGAPLRKFLLDPTGITDAAKGFEEGGPRGAVKQFLDKNVPMGEPSPMFKSMFNNRIPLRMGPSSKVESGGGPPGARDNVPTEPVASNVTDFVKTFEGWNPKAYDDYGQRSIGYGTRAKRGEKTISKAEAERRLAKELSSHRERVERANAKYGYGWTPEQMDALTSFDYNTGDLEKLIAKGKRDNEEIASKMLLYNKAGGKVLRGLQRRRTAESRLFESGYNS